jgi:hypothetical protein
MISTSALSDGRLAPVTLCHTAQPDTPRRVPDTCRKSVSSERSSLVSRFP